MEVKTCNKSTGIWTRKTWVCIPVMALEWLTIHRNPLSFDLFDGCNKTLIPEFFSGLNKIMSVEILTVLLSYMVYYYYIIDNIYYQYIIIIFTWYHHCRRHHHLYYHIELLSLCVCVCVCVCARLFILREVQLVRIWWPRWWGQWSIGDGVGLCLISPNRLPHIVTFSWTASLTQNHWCYFLPS